MSSSTEPEAIPPSAWGPQLWPAIHLVALCSPEVLDARTAEAYEAFFTGLVDVIPCGTCAANYRRHLLELPIGPFLSGGRGDLLFDWTVRMHNLVNAEVKRPGSRADWTPDQARDALLRHVGVRGAPGPLSCWGRVAASPALTALAVVCLVFLGAASALGVLAIARRSRRRR